MFNEIQVCDGLGKNTQLSRTLEGIKKGNKNKKNEREVTVEKEQENRRELTVKRKHEN